MSLRNIVKFALYIVPEVFVYIAPVALLCSIFYLHYSMFSDNELVILQSAGVSTWGIIKPIFFVTILITGISYVCVSFLVPYSKEKILDQKQLITSIIVPKVITAKKFINVSDMISMYINEKRGDKVEGLIIYDKRDSRDDSVIIAKTAEVIVYKDSILFKMYNGSRQTVHKDALQMIFFDTLLLNVPFVSYVPGGKVSLEMLGLISLLKYVPSNKEQAENKQLAIHRRLSWPIIIVGFMFISVSFLFSKGYNRLWDSKALLKVSSAISLYVFLYFFFKNGILTTAFFVEAMYINNIAFILFGVLYLRYKTRSLRKVQ